MGLDIICRTPQSYRKLSIVSAVNYGPSSEYRIMGVAVTTKVW